MKGYIYTMYKGADPSAGWEMTDPIFKGIPSMGACRPDVRRIIERGDYIFPISGKIIKVQQHIVGGFSVDEKINALTAYDRFPENRMYADDDGKLHGNIIINGNGEHIKEDYHTNWENRLENYIVGKEPIFFERKDEIERAKQETLLVLNEIFSTEGSSVYEILGRFGKKLNEEQVKHILHWMDKIKGKP